MPFLEGNNSGSKIMLLIQKWVIHTNPFDDGGFFCHKGVSFISNSIGIVNLKYQYQFYMVA